MATMPDGSDIGVPRMRHLPQIMDYWHRGLWSVSQPEKWVWWWRTKGTRFWWCGVRTL